MSKLLPVTKVVSDYSAEELMRFREQFAPVVQKNRQYCRKLGLRMAAFFSPILFGIFICIIGGIAMGPESDMPKWVIGCLLSLGLISLLAIVSLVAFPLPRLHVECPSCNNPILTRFLGHYCPECGSRQLEPGNWLRLPRCTACGKHIRFGRGRHFTIRACTHCGVFLDEKGF
jgi:predicted RNA-binding Zn-ribbon protein involved in translation (DUF1610 family)